MAMQTERPAPVPSAQVVGNASVVGNAFVEQYYHILHQSPDVVYRFYQDSSVLSRPEPNGVMTSVTTMKAIDDKIMSLNYKDYKAEIRTVDAQESYKEGVVVLVTGWVTGKDNIRKKFTQSFFLAPQGKSYFVLNDVFRYVEDYELVETDPVSANGLTDSATTVPLTPDPESAPFPEYTVPDSSTPLSGEDLNDVEVACDQSEKDEVVEEVVVAEVPLPITQDEVHPMVETASSTVQKDFPKKSYASIVKAMKGSTTPTSGYVPSKTVRVTPVNSDQQSSRSSALTPAPEASTPSSNNALEISNVQEEVEGHSIYIRALPLNATIAKLEEEFKKFGPIKHGGIQVRSNKQQGFCFGFVEFESLNSMHSAVEASPVMIGGCQAFIEEKRTTRRVGSGRGRFPSGRGGLRNDNFRGRGNFGGNWSYGRNDFGNRGDFSEWEPILVSEESYRCIDQNGRGWD